MVGRAGARVGLRTAVVGVVAAAIMVVTAGAPAEAKRRKASSYSPPYAAIVVDANNGEVLHASNPDARRHPASLTKIMTLYLLFEQIEAGRFKLDTPLTVSAHAASQAPSKLGLRPGQTIEVEDAILALVTKSANDIAVVIAESIAGNEGDFAAMMTRKARALGMSNTVYKNASGLPNDAQVTTARDQAILGRAIQDRFPRFYRYFATENFNFRGRNLRNHNKLLGRVDGVDGIKTGYTRASGFNLVTSMRRGNRHIVGVVLGGPSGSWRDARMRALIEDKIQVASTRRTVGKIAEAPSANEPRVRAAAAAEPIPAPIARPDDAPQAKPEPVRTPAPTVVAAAAGTPVPLPPARADTTTTAAVPPRPAPGSTEPIQPVRVKTIAVRPGNVQTAALGPITAPQPTASNAQLHMPSSALGLAPPPGARPGVLGVLPVEQVPTVGDTASASATSTASAVPAAPAETASSARARPVARGDWMIQIGAFPDETAAHERLKSAKSVAGEVLASADPFTERVMKGDRPLYRARFAGFEKDQAQAACKYLKRNDIACLALKN